MKRPISRRTVLRGAGVALTLPWLEGLQPRRALAAPNPVARFLCMYFPNGAAADFWTPTGQGEAAGWQLSPLLQPFASLKQKMTVLTNVENYSAMQGDQFVEPSHARCTGAFLTCHDSDLLREQNGGAEPINGVSLDQVIAAAIGNNTVLPSMQTGLSTLNSYEDGRHASLSRSISWASQQQPLFKEVNPQAVFDRLVSAGAVNGGNGGGGMEEDPEAARRRALKKSALDYILDATNRVSAKLGAADKIRLDQFLTSVRTLEQRVSAVAGTMAPSASMCSVGNRPPDPYAVANVPDGYNRGVHADVMNDLLVMALQCDVTRVITHMLDDARSDFVYDHLTNREFNATGSTAGNGQVAGFHGLQHAGDSNNGYATINHWLAERTHALCERLDEIQEGDGTLLDNTVVLYGSGMHGSNHDANELPIALIGGGGLGLRTDQHVVFPATPGDRPLRDVYHTLLKQCYGVDMAFGRSVNGAAPQLVTELIA